MRWLIAVTGVLLGCAASTIVGAGQERSGNQNGRPSGTPSTD